MRPHWIPNRFVCMCVVVVVRALSWNRNLIDAGPRARSRQPKDEELPSRLLYSRRCVSFQGRYDSPYRSNWCFIAPVTASADKCFFFLLLPFFFYLLFIIWKKKKKVPNFFFLSYSTDHYRYRILWFFSSVFGGCWWMTTILHLATNETAISVGSLSFFVVVGLTPSDRFVITFLSPEKFLFLFHNYPVVFDNLRPIIVKLLFFFMAGERKRVSNANHRTFPLIFCSHLFWLNRKF